MLSTTSDHTKYLAQSHTHEVLPLSSTAASCVFGSATKLGIKRSYWAYIEADNGRRASSQSREDPSGFSNYAGKDPFSRPIAALAIHKLQNWPNLSFPSGDFGQSIYPTHAILRHEAKFGLITMRKKLCETCQSFPIETFLMRKKLEFPCRPVDCPCCIILWTGIDRFVKTWEDSKEISLHNEPERLFVRVQENSRVLELQYYTPLGKPL